MECAARDKRVRRAAAAPRASREERHSAAPSPPSQGDGRKKGAHRRSAEGQQGAPPLQLKTEASAASGGEGSAGPSPSRTVRRPRVAPLGRQVILSAPPPTRRKLVPVGAKRKDREQRRHDMTLQQRCGRSGKERFPAVSPTARREEACRKRMEERGFSPSRRRRAANSRKSRCRRAANQSNNGPNSR